MAAPVNSGFNFDHLSEAVNAIKLKITEGQLDQDGRVKKASAGVLFLRDGNKGLEAFLGKSQKPVDQDPEEVRGTFVTLSGKIEKVDRDIIDIKKSQIPVVIKAAMRETAEESNRMIPREETLGFLADPNTKLVKNASWEHFQAAVFAGRHDILEQRLEAINATAKCFPKGELSEFRWISVADIEQAQKAKDDEYQAKLADVEREVGRSLSEKEKNENAMLSAIYKKHLTLSDGSQVAAYVARTIFLAKALFR